MLDVDTIWSARRACRQQLVVTTTPPTPLTGVSNGATLLTASSHVCLLTPIMVHCDFPLNSSEQCQQQPWTVSLLQPSRCVMDQNNTATGMNFSIFVANQSIQQMNLACRRSSCCHVLITRALFLSNSIHHAKSNDQLLLSLKIKSDPRLVCPENL